MEIFRKKLYFQHQYKNCNFHIKIAFIWNYIVGWGRLVTLSRVGAFWKSQSALDYKVSLNNIIASNGRKLGKVGSFVGRPRVVRKSPSCLPERSLTSSFCLLHSVLAPDWLLPLVALAQVPMWLPWALYVQKPHGPGTHPGPVIKR